MWDILVELGPRRNICRCRKDTLTSPEADPEPNYFTELLAWSGRQLASDSVKIAHHTAFYLRADAMLIISEPWP
jgi:hypothetical protein